MAQKQDSALTVLGEVGLEAHYSPFVNCQQEAVTLAGHLNNPLKNKMALLIYHRSISHRTAGIGFCFPSAFL